MGFVWGGKRSTLSKRVSKTTYQFTWVIGIEDEESIIHIESLIMDDDLDLNSSQGYIQLEGDGERLSINMVRRPIAWPKNQQFCKPLLRSAVVDYYKRIPFSINDLREISVTNFANPRIAGCRCYVRLMLDMGVDVIQGEAGITLNTVEKFCEIDHMYIVGEVGDTASFLPHSESSADKLIQDAFLDQLEIIPFIMSPEG